MQHYGPWYAVASYIWSWISEHPIIREWAVKQFRRPKLVLTMTITDYKCHEPVMLNGWLSAPEFELGKMLRIRLENFGVSPATSCRVYIDQIMFNEKVIAERELSNVLSWIDDPDFGPKTLPPHIPTYVNLARVRSDSAIMQFCTKANLAGAHQVSAYGDYEVKIRAEGDNFVSPGEITVRIWHDPNDAMKDEMDVVEQRGKMRLA